MVAQARQRMKKSSGAAQWFRLFVALILGYFLARKGTGSNGTHYARSGAPVRVDPGVMEQVLVNIAVKPFQLNKFLQKIRDCLDAKSAAPRCNES
jgi:hypothetical protein